MALSDRQSILYLSYDGLTDQLGQSQIIPYLKGLAAQGFKITIISFEKKKTFKVGASQVQQICEMNMIHWIPLEYHKFPPVFSTIFDLFLLRRRVLQLMKSQSFDIVHCRSYITALVGNWLKVKYGIKFVFDMRGFWANERVEGGLWKLKNPVYKSIFKFFKQKETEFYENADQIVVLTHSAKQIISNAVKPDKITVIPCCVELDKFKPDGNHENRINLRTQLNITSDDFILLYLGSLGTWYLLDEMLLFFEKVKEKFPNAKFLIVTQDQQKAPNRRDIRVVSASRAAVPGYINISNASVCFIKPTFSKKASSATKMAEVLAMNVPMYTNDNWGDIDILKGKVNGLNIVDLSNITFLPPIAFQQTNEFFNMFSLNTGIDLYSSVYYKCR